MRIGLAGAVGLLMLMEAQVAIQAAPLPATPLDCALAPGTVITAFAASGDPANSIRWTVPARSTSFAMSGALLVVGPQGISATDCGKTDTLAVTATFRYTTSITSTKPSLVADDGTTVLNADDSTTPLIGQ